LGFFLPLMSTDAFVARNIILGHNHNMEYLDIVFSGHAIRRMFERQISKSDVIYVAKKGQVVESYPTDTPYPSYLLLGIIDKRPIHAVIAISDEQNCIVITVYEPSNDLWDENFSKRRSS